MWFGLLLALLQIVVGVTSLLLMLLLLLLHRGRTGSLSDILGDELTSILGGPAAAQRRIAQVTIILGALEATALVALSLMTPFKH